VKRICLVKDERTYWTTIEEFLRGVNAITSVVSGVPRPEEILALNPDLIVSNAKAHHGMPRAVRKIPIIVIKEGSPPVALVRDTSDRNLLITGWPMEREQLLEITSRMLSVAPRRAFRTLIRIFTQDDDIGILGQSHDFSLSGLAFWTEKVLSSGEEVKISFSLPEANHSLRLGAQVMRTTPLEQGDGRWLYGARFTGLGEKDRGLLTSFVLRG